MTQSDLIEMMAEPPSEKVQQQLAKLSGQDLVDAHRNAVMWAASSSPGNRYWKWQDAIEAELLRRLG